MVVPNCEYGEDGIFIFSDSGLNEYPDADALSEIAISSAKSFEQLVGKEPKVAMLSYSTYGSAHSPLTDKVVEATKLLKQKAPGLICDGELQLDAAIIPEIPYDINKIVEKINKRKEEGKKFSIIVVSEGAKPKDGEMVIKKTLNDGKWKISRNI